MLGYEGLELAPHTLAEDATLLPASERTRIRSEIRSAGLDCVGLHWLLVSPPGLKATAAEPAERSRTWNYVHRCIELCADLAAENRYGGGVIVLGSPKQRSTPPGMSAAEGTQILTDELRRAASAAERLGVTLLIEAIPSTDTNLVNTLEEAVAVVRAVGSSRVQTMFDVHNAADETDSHAALLRRFLFYIRHVHVNESDGGEPGAGNYDFNQLLSVLRELGYAGWISVEAFDFSRPGHEIAARAIQRLKASVPAVV